MPAVYFMAGLIAGLAIAWYYTKLHYEKGAQTNRQERDQRDGHTTFKDETKQGEKEKDDQNEHKRDL